MAIIFDGRKFKREKEGKLREKVLKLLREGVVPKLSVVLVGENRASSLYVDLKSKAASRIGCKVEVLKFPSDSSLEAIEDVIEERNKDPLVHGIMIQLPLPPLLSKYKERIIEKIAKHKDVDGLRKESVFSHPTAMAVFSIFKQALHTIKAKDPLIIVVGKGMVGGHLVKEFEKAGYRVESVGKETQDFLEKVLSADVLVSATGVEGLIKGGMVKKGAVVIDVGEPKGDVDFESVKKKASFITPVPGGVGPVTISFLLDNLVSSAYNTKNAYR